MKARRARLASLAALSVAAALWWTRAPTARAVLPAVEADAFAALTGRAAASTPELWERLKAMGVAAVVLREETAAELASRGAMLHFSRAEIEKWRELGLIAPDRGPKPDSLWARDGRVLTRLSGALGPVPVEKAGRGGSAFSGSAAAWTLELPPGVDLARVPAGFDPETVAAVSAAGLIPVAAGGGPFASVAGRRLWTRVLPVGARPSEILRAVHGRAMRLLVFRPSAGAGLDDNLERLRAALKIVKSAGLPAVLPAAAPDAARSRAENAARLFLLYAIGLAGPLFAARAALGAERTVRGWVAARAAIAAPVPETLAGLSAAWAAASAAGLLAAASVAPERREELARGWTLWTLSAPMVAGAAALLGSEGPALRARWRAPLRARDLAAALVLALALLGLLAPRAALRAVSAWESADRFASAADALWWWQWRWREILIGAPSLMLALILVGRRETPVKGDGAAGVSVFFDDPRGWLVLGLLAPAGAVAAIGAGGAPPALAVAHGAAAWALGATLGLVWAGLGAWVRAWVDRPGGAQVY
ncbi:MAG: hypothetical protein HY403_00585 [Elusimicrobia bacterium]|nr:hypothetical protein [Elusimicrobiota bacterium]